MTPSRGRRASALILLPLLSSTAGCSYAFVHGPPAPREASPTEVPQNQRVAASCTESNALPILDTVVAVPLLGLGVLGFVGAATDTCTSNCWVDTKGALVGVGVAGTALGVLLLASAITGYGRTADSRHAQETLPGASHQSARHLLDVNGIAEARTQAARRE